MIRETSRMSSISCACSLALRPMTSMAWRIALGREAAALQHLHPAEDRVQRRPQLVRQRGEEFVLQAARFFGGGEPRELGFLAPRDHHADAGHADRLPVLVLDAALSFAPAHRAVGRDDAVLDVVRHAFGSARAATDAQHALAIVGVNLALVAGEGAVEGAGGQAVNPLEVVRPLHRCSSTRSQSHVPIEAASSAKRSRSSLRRACSSARVRSTAKATCDAINAGELQLVGATASAAPRNTA